jgi:hypothetical protein
MQHHSLVTAKFFSSITKARFHEKSALRDTKSDALKDHYFPQGAVLTDGYC